MLGVLSYSSLSSGAFQTSYVKVVLEGGPKKGLLAELNPGSKTAPDCTDLVSLGCGCKVSDTGGPVSSTSKSYSFSESTSSNPSRDMLSGSSLARDISASELSARVLLLDVPDVLDTVL